MDNKQAKDILRSHQLRATAPRIGVIKALSELRTPVTYTELLHKLGDVAWDPATIFRNLIKLSEEGICKELTQANGATRYALVNDGDEYTKHQHPHFVCQSCGNVSCLPATVSMDVPKKWLAAVQRATIQISGECPECVEAHEKH